MPADMDPVPIRGPQGWTTPLRLGAAAQLHTQLKQVSKPRDIARVGADFFRELLDARLTSVTTLEAGQFTELANVGTLPPPSGWYPKETVYPESVFPSTTQKLRAGGYFTDDLDDPEYLELVGSRDDPAVLSVMGVPIVVDGQLRGELFTARGLEQRGFDEDDLDASRELAVLLGEALRAAPIEPGSRP
jgi:transcriptional regulator with GAF, ATPase, and Fis domain